MRYLDIHLEFPQEARVTPAQRKSARKAATEAVVLDLYCSRAIGGYYAARLLGMEYYDFLDMLASKEISATMTKPKPEQVRGVKSQNG